MSGPIGSIFVLSLSTLLLAFAAFAIAITYDILRGCPP